MKTKNYVLSSNKTPSARALSWSWAPSTRIRFVWKKKKMRQHVALLDRFHPSTRKRQNDSKTQMPLMVYAHLPEKWARKRVRAPCGAILRALFEQFEYVSYKRVKLNILFGQTTNFNFLFKLLLTTKSRKRQRMLTLTFYICLLHSICLQKK